MDRTSDGPPSRPDPAIAGSEASSQPRGSAGSTILSVVGLTYLGLGILLGVVYFGGGIQSSLFPTGWIFPAVLVASGILMTLRRRFDLAATLWGALVLAVFLLGVLVYMNALDRGLDDAVAFDAALIVAGFGLVVLVLRPYFKD